MTKKDFELIARVIRETPLVNRGEVADAFAAELWAMNPRFDAQRFRAACLGEDSTDSAGRKARYSTDPLAGQRN